MTTIERKSKFEKSKALIRKKEKRKKEKPEFEKHIFEKRFIDGLKVKPITNKILDKLILDQNVVNLNDSDGANMAIILSYNSNFLIAINFSDHLNFGELSIFNIEEIEEIKLIKTPKSQLIKQNFNITNHQFNFFNKRNVFKNIPDEMSQTIHQYLNLNNYLQYSSFNIENKKELYMFLKELNIPITFYISSISPTLYSKIINVTDELVQIKAMETDNGLFISDIIDVNFEEIEHVLINLFDKRSLEEETFNRNFDTNDHDLLIKKINSNYSFVTKLDDSSFRRIIYRLEGNNSIDLNWYHISILNYLIENPHEVELIKKKYNYNKSIIENISDHFDFEVDFDVDFNNLNDCIFKIVFKSSKGYEHDDFDDESNNEIGNYYLIDSDEDTITIRSTSNDSTILTYKKNIKRITKVFSRNVINKQFINVNKHFKNKVCWITTYNFDWCFIVDEIDDEKIIARSLHSQCCASKKQVTIKLDSVLYIEIESEYINFLTLSYNKFSKTSLVSNYENLYDEIIDLKKEYFDEVLGFNWFIDTINFLENYKIIVFWACAIEDKNKKLNCEFELKSLYKIIPESFSIDNDFQNFVDENDSDDDDSDDEDDDETDYEDETDSDDEILNAEEI